MKETVLEVRETRAEKNAIEASLSVNVSISEICMDFDKNTYLNNYLVVMLMRHVGNTVSQEE